MEVENHSGLVIPHDNIDEVDGTREAILDNDKIEHSCIHIFAKM